MIVLHEYGISEAHTMVRAIYDSVEISEGGSAKQRVLATPWLMEQYNALLIDVIREHKPTNYSYAGRSKTGHWLKDDTFVIETKIHYKYDPY